MFHVAVLRPGASALELPEGCATLNRVQRCGLLAVLAVLVGLAAGCAGDDVTSPAASASSPPTCPAQFRAGWQRLANRVDAPVYCPRWLPDPLKPEAHLHSPIGADRSWQIGFHEYELRSVELHVVVSGYPNGRPPQCEDLKTGEFGSCWQERHGTRRIGDRVVTVYERGVGHEASHVVYAWRERGTLYAASMHVDHRPNSALPRSRVKNQLARVVQSLVPIEPGHGVDAHGDDGHDDEDHEH